MPTEKDDKVNVKTVAIYCSKQLEWAMGKSGIDSPEKVIDEALELWFSVVQKLDELGKKRCRLAIVEKAGTEDVATIHIVRLPERLEEKNCG